ncbi:hypothetical protein CF336_g6573 [Tilletia laevis]|uniref:Uncharacterized protein n=1 Tax=Tilletia caries TaxID=13290 RepID=A0A177U2V5_9BASI|nr:hypothetical protein CF336_g6573 [Tilletia laevis]KAE8189889.1 hypothetical protein CF328_g6138 [Tilletia controversa]KAE8191399.1 hypothetical protein CF335_g6100 [Tilletia laevis]KAE8253645.1 hypothetical protein A4X03_0g5836 [Tilletia caries]
MFYPCLLLIGPFLLLATLAKSAPLPDPSYPGLSPTSSLKARAGPSSSGEAAGDVNLFEKQRKLYIDDFIQAKTKAWELALLSESPSPDQAEHINKLEQYATKVGVTVKNYSELIEKLKNVRP